MILNKTHSNSSDETQYTIFMNNIVRRWPSVEKIYIKLEFLYFRLSSVFSLESSGRNTINWSQIDQSLIEVW